MRRALTLTLALVSVGCGDRRGADGADDPRAGPLGTVERRTTPLEENLTGPVPFVLEEDDESVVVDPETRVTPDGGLLMADRAEHQVRRYDPDGRLLWRFGREGRGPTDLLSPIRALRLADSTVFVVSDRAHDALWAPGGDSVRYTLARRSLRLPRDATVLADTLVAIGTEARFRMDTTFQDPLVEIVRGRDGESLWDVFLPEIDGLPMMAVGMTGLAAVAARGDTLAAAFSLGRAVHLLTPDGRPVDTVPVPFVRYEAPADLGRDEFMEQAVDSTLDHTLVQGLHWLSDGSFLLELLDRRDGPGDPVWHLLRMTREGRFRFESPGRLRAVDPERLRVWVQDPGRLEPNRWRVGTLEPAGSG